MQNEPTMTRRVVISRYGLAMLLTASLSLITGFASDGKAAETFELVQDQLIALAEQARAACEVMAADAQAAADRTESLAILADHRLAEANRTAQTVAAATAGDVFKPEEADLPWYEMATVPTED